MEEFKQLEVEAEAELLDRAVAKAAAGDALAASLLQDHVRHFKGLLTIIKVISSILFF